MQKLTVIGNLTRDPDLRYLPNGTQVCNFTVAVNKRWKTQDGEKRESVTYYDMSAWRQQAEICGKYLTKGSKVYVEATDMVLGKYTDKGGEVHPTAKWTLKEVEFLGSGKGGQGVESYDEGDVKQVSIANGNDLDDIPF